MQQEPLLISCYRHESASYQHVLLSPSFYPRWQQGWRDGSVGLVVSLLPWLGDKYLDWIECHEFWHQHSKSLKFPVGIKSSGSWGNIHLMDWQMFVWRTFSADKIPRWCTVTGLGIPWLFLSGNSRPVKHWHAGVVTVGMLAWQSRATHSCWHGCGRWLQPSGAWIKLFFSKWTAFIKIITAICAQFVIRLKSRLHMWRTATLQSLNSDGYSRFQQW